MNIQAIVAPVVLQGCVFGLYTALQDGYEATGKALNAATVAVGGIPVHSVPSPQSIVLQMSVAPASLPFPGEKEVTIWCVPVDPPYCSSLPYSAACSQSLFTSRAASNRSRPMPGPPPRP